MELRDYQKKAFEHIVTTLPKVERYLLFAPCAAGKTVLFCKVIESLPCRSLILMDRKNLVRQTADRLQSYIGTKCGIVCSGVQAIKEYEERIVIASRQSLTPILPSILPFDIIVLDETHLLNPYADGQYYQIIRAMPDVKVLGVTATPYRMNGRIYGEGKLFPEINYRITHQELLQNGWVVPLEFKVNTSDLLDKLDNTSKAPTGELVEAEHLTLLSQPVYIKTVVDVYEKYCLGKNTVVYALNIQHAELVHKAFAAAGHSAQVIHSKMSGSLVNSIVESFSGILINVGILTIGSDIPSIERVILARRILSTSLFFQIIGRAARRCPEIGKEKALIIDLCGSVLIHGDDPDNPILQFDASTNTTAPKKVCPLCESLIGSGMSVCPCGFIFPKVIQGSKKIRETRRVVDINNYKPVYTIIDIDRIRFEKYKGAKGISVKGFFYSGNKFIVAQWFYPHYSKGSFPKIKADKFWRSLGGKYPMPRSVDEWLKRCHTLDQGCTLYVNFEKQPYPEIRNVERL